MNMVLVTYLDGSTRLFDAEDYYLTEGNFIGLDLRNDHHASVAPGQWRSVEQVTVHNAGVPNDSPRGGSKQ